MCTTQLYKFPTQIVNSLFSSEIIRKVIENSFEIKIYKINEANMSILISYLDSFYIERHFLLALNWYYRAYKDSFLISSI